MTSIVKPIEPLRIDRNSLLDPEKELEEGVVISRIGESDDAKDEQDVRSLAMSSLDLTKCRFETTLMDGEKFIGVEKKIERLKSEFPHLVLPDAKIALALWNESGHKTLEWIREERGVTFLDFLGTVFTGIGGGRFVLFVHYRNGSWELGHFDLAGRTYSRNWSLVIEP